MQNSKKTLLQQIEIPNYLTHVQLSSERRAKYYKKGGKALPKRYLGTKYSFDSKGFLIDNQFGERVIANSRSVGTPQYKKLNTQLLYVGGGKSFLMRAKIMKILKEYFMPYVKQLKPVPSEMFPVKFLIEFHTHIEKGDWDLDNHSWIYTKGLQDTLKDAGIIPDDNIQFIQNVEFDFKPVTEDKHRKIVLNIYSQS